MWRACIPAPDAFFQIEFGMDPERFGGAEVLVDGVPVGVLERRRSRAINGFPIGEGPHEVALRKEGFRSRATRLSGGFGSGRRLLVADIEPGPPGEPETLVLRR